VEPGFSAHARQAEWAELDGDFTTVTTVIMAAVNVVDIHSSGGHGEMS
jgi:hypothetical protein